MGFCSLSSSSLGSAWGAGFWTAAPCSALEMLQQDFGASKKCTHILVNHSFYLLNHVHVLLNHAHALLNCALHLLRWPLVFLMHPPKKINSSHDASRAPQCVRGAEQAGEEKRGERRKKRRGRSGGGGGEGGVRSEECVFGLLPVLWNTRHDMAFPLARPPAGLAGLMGAVLQTRQGHRESSTPGYQTGRARR